MKDRNKNNELVKKLLSGNASRREMEELAEWSFIENRMKKQLKEVETEAADQAIGKRIWNNIDKRCDKQPVESRITKMKYWKLAAAACIAILATIGIFWLTDNGIPQNVPEYIDIFAKKKQMHTLPDGSRIWMQAGSHIRLAKDFEANRKVWLNGETTFEVKKVQGKTFKVYINQAYIEVKGTAFRIEETEDNRSEITLFNGKIDFNTTVSGRKIQMSPQQKIIFHPKQDDITLKNIGNINWEEGRYKFADIRLDSLAQIISSIYHVPVSIDKKVNQRHFFTGSIQYDDPITKVIERICFNMNLKYKKEEKKIIIY